MADLLSLSDFFASKYVLQQPDLIDAINQQLITDARATRRINGIRNPREKLIAEAAYIWPLLSAVLKANIREQFVEWAGYEPAAEPVARPAARRAGAKRVPRRRQGNHEKHLDNRDTQQKRRMEEKMKGAAEGNSKIIESGGYRIGDTYTFMDCQGSWYVAKIQDVMPNMSLWVKYVEYPSDRHDEEIKVGEFMTRIKEAPVDYNVAEEMITHERSAVRTANHGRQLSCEIISTNTAMNNGTGDSASIMGAMAKEFVNLYENQETYHFPDEYGDKGDIPYVKIRQIYFGVGRQTRKVLMEMCPRLWYCLMTFITHSRVLDDYPTFSDVKNLVAHIILNGPAVWPEIFEDADHARLRGYIEKGTYHAAFDMIPNWFEDVKTV